jgi:hypothetical protein
MYKWCPHLASPEFFLLQINEDATIWAKTWDHPHLAPAQKYVQEIIYHRNQGIFAPVIPEDPTEGDKEFWADYRIDWQMIDNEGIMRHHQ